jgi:hypothetical protein
MKSLNLIFEQFGHYNYLRPYEIDDTDGLMKDLLFLKIKKNNNKLLSIYN